MINMKRWLSILIVVCVLLTGCVTTAQLQHYEAQGVLNTNGGMPGIIINSDIENVRNVVIESMVGQGYTILSESEHLVSFSQQMGGAGDFMYQALAGSAYSTTPERYVNVNMVEVPQGTKVMMSTGATIQQGFGRVDKRDHSARNTSLMEWLLHFKNTVANQAYEPIAPEESDQAREDIQLLVEEIKRKQREQKKPVKNFNFEGGEYLPFVTEMK